jgi:hypothetical protein
MQFLDSDSWARDRTLVPQESTVPRHSNSLSFSPPQGLLWLYRYSLGQSQDVSKAQRISVPEVEDGRALTNLQNSYC